MLQRLTQSWPVLRTSALPLYWRSFRPALWKKPQRRGVWWTLMRRRPAAWDSDHTLRQAGETPGQCKVSRASHSSVVRSELSPCWVLLHTLPRWSHEIRPGIGILPFCTWEHQGLESAGGLPRILQLGNGRTRAPNARPSI